MPTACALELRKQAHPTSGDSHQVSTPQLLSVQECVVFGGSGTRSVFIRTPWALEDAALISVWESSQCLPFFEQFLLCFLILITQPFVHLASSMTNSLLLALSEEGTRQCLPSGGQLGLESVEPVD